MRNRLEIQTTALLWVLFGCAPELQDKERYSNLAVSETRLPNAGSVKVRSVDAAVSAQNSDEQSDVDAASPNAVGDDAESRDAALAPEAADASVPEAGAGLSGSADDGVDTEGHPPNTLPSDDALPEDSVSNGGDDVPDSADDVADEGDAVPDNDDDALDDTQTASDSDVDPTPDDTVDTPTIDEVTEPEGPTCPPRGSPRSCAQPVEAIFRSQSCSLSVCHGTEQSAPLANLDLAFDLTDLAVRLGNTLGTAGCADKRIIDVHDPESSLLLDKLEEQPSCGTKMPPPGFDVRFTDVDRQCIKDWVLEQAACLQETAP